MNLQVISFGLLATIIGSQVEADNPKNQIDVRAVGTVTVPSDSIVLRTSITSTHKSDLQEAKKRNDQLTAPIYQLAETRQVARPTLLATRVSFNFEPAQEGGAQDVPKPSANQQEFIPQGNQRYQVKYGGKEYPPGPPEPPIHMSRELEIKFKGLTDAIGFASEMTKWEVVRKTCEIRMAPLEFTVTDREKCLADARRRAVAIAREKAQLLAQANGLKLGNATLIYDDSSDTVRAPYSAVPGLLPPASDDPFGASLLRSSKPTFRLAAMQREAAEKTDLDQIPPAQVAVAASVRIVYEVIP
jgi:uncharacterized protein YggE